MNVLPLKKYCELEGTKPAAVKRRIQLGIWKLGREVLKIDGFRQLFVDTEAVDRYLRDPKNHRNNT
ncbi:hypothetical protein [Vibrio alginolyticus]|uniref:hypothetical protein n=1 Tax=Vibrio alginolyticus TaxID=663 RepID=UPI000720C870|nr:hypothetical protein [Vibrio alginolyticus]ALR91715.1 hypothetical protein AT730_04645 [Vibrio alginolyticus]MBY7710534.1 hypothetical protein [Vibrio alginolyticus]